MKTGFSKIRKRVVIVEDEEDLRIAYKAIIDDAADFAVIAVYGTAEEAIQRVKKDKPDVVMMDITLPGKDGVDATEIIKDALPHCQVVMLTVHEESELVFKALKAGASGYLTKSAGVSDLIMGLKEIINGGAPMSSRIARMVIDDFRRNPNSPLSARETQVMQLLSEGKTFTQIAEELFIARETVKSHLRNIYDKLKVNRKSEALAKAQKEKYL